MTQPVSETDIAVIGMACRLPGARSPDEFWENLVAGREAIVPLSDDTLRKNGVPDALVDDSDYVKVHAPIPDLKSFDSGFFGFSPREAEILDPQHRQFLETAWESFEHAGHVPGGFPGAVGVFAGSGHHHYLSQHVLKKPDLLRDVGFFLLRHTGNDKDFLATRVSYLLDLRGPSITVQTACSTSLVAVHLAAQSLLSNECDMALAGGVTIELPHGRGYRYAQGEILSPDGHCRPFDERAQGTVFGSGCGAIVLRRLSDALADGDTVHAVIKGTAVNNDGGQKVGYLAPSVDGQAQVITEALAMARVEPETISLIEAHGTGTPVGDPIELAALTQAFEKVALGSIAIGSVKGNIGHLDTAAGTASLIKVIQSLRHAELAPTLHFLSPNPECDFPNTPFRVQAEGAPWRSKGPRRAGVSSLGVGGTNAHIVLEEAPTPAPTRSAHPPHLLTLSAKTPEALERQIERLATHLEQEPAITLPDVAWTLQVGREAMTYRASFAVEDVADAASQLRDRGTLKKSIRKEATPAPQVVFTFAGGGTQFPGMGRDLYDSEPPFREMIDRGLNELLERQAIDLRPYLRANSGDLQTAHDLERPSRALPSLFIVQAASVALWRSWGVDPSGLLGHSMGEYTAAYVGGVLSFEDALALVHKRGELFESVAPGGMLSVALSADALRPMLDERLAIAAENAPELSVVSGPDEALADFERTLAAQGVESARVHIRIAAHSPMLDPILEEWRAFVQTIRFSHPKVPILSNLSGDFLTNEQAVDPEYWVRQLRETVRFADGVATLLGPGPRVLLECGPGNTMTTLARQHPLREVRHELATSMSRAGDPASDRVVAIQSLGRLWSMGLTPDWPSVHHGLLRRRIPLPTYPFDRVEHWIEAPDSDAAPEQSMESLSKSPDLDRWCFQNSWKRNNEIVVGQLPTQALLLGGDASLRAALVARLSAEGVEVTFVGADDLFRETAPGSYVLDPERPEHFRDLFHSLGKAQRLPGLVIHAWNVGTPTRLPNADRAGLSSVESVGSVVWLAQAIMLANGPQSVRLNVLTSGAQAVGSEPIRAPLRAMAAAVCRVISTEGDALTAHAIDIEWPMRDGKLRERVIASLMAEFGSAASASSVLLRSGERWEPDFVSLPLKTSGPVPVSLREGGVYLITGGLGGIGLEVAGMLARQVRARLALVSRKTLPPEPEWKALLASPDTDRSLRMQIRIIQRLRDEGTEVLVLSGDVADRRVAKKIVGQVVSQLGELHGVFHAAGTLDDSLLGQKTPTSIERVLRPKLQGCLALNEATNAMTLDCFVMFSSTSALLGLAGQADYAAANAFMDAFAHWRSDHRPGRTISINWSVWREVGMAARLGEAEGVALPVGGQSRGLNHHILERVVVDTPDELEISGRLHSERDWLLAEHRLSSGESVVPGAGFLDFVVAAMRVRMKDGPVSLREVVFTEPCVVTAEEEREVRVRIVAGDRGTHAFAVRSRPCGRPAEWVEHCSGFCEFAPAEKSRQTTCSIADLRKRVGPGVSVPPGEAPSVHVDFGPRWRCVKSRAIGTGEALLDLELGAAYAKDLVETAMHPALLDMGTAGAQMLLDDFVEARHFFVPVSYGEIIVHGAFVGRMVSYVRLRPGADADSDTAIYDVQLFATDGRLIAELHEFTMFRLRDAAGLRPSAEFGRASAAGASIAEALRLGILPTEGTDILLRALDGPMASQIVVAPAGHRQVTHRVNLEATSRIPTQRPEDAALELAPPRTQLQRDIVDMVAEMLGMDRVGINEDLVDIGLHSLLAVRLFNRLQRLTGRNIPLTALLEAPTIEQLAPKFGDVGEETNGAARDPAASGEFAEEPASASIGVYENVEMPDRDAYILPPEEDIDAFSSLVPLKPSGSRTPFFVIHARGGAVLNYHPLTKFVDPDQPVYGLQSQGLDGVTEPHREIENMAAHYLKLVRRVQPHGPYLLAGGSLGGIVALEMAHQLKVQGEETGFLAMFDSWGPDVFMDTARPTASDHISSKSGRVLTLLRERGAVRTVRAIRRRVQSLVEEMVTTASVRWHRISQLILHRQLPHAIRYQFVERVNLMALRIYRPQPWEGEVVLFRALDDPDFSQDDPTMGWSETVKGNIRILDCPGTHNTVMKGPVFGQYLSEELRKRQGPT